MEIVFIYVVLVMLGFSISYWMAQIPIFIANKRKIIGNKLIIIEVLSCCGIISFGITWFIAIILSLIFKPNNINKKQDTFQPIMQTDNFEILEKLFKLKDIGIISNDEFQREKDKIMGNL